MSSTTGTDDPTSTAVVVHPFASSAVTFVPSVKLSYQGRSEKIFINPKLKAGKVTSFTPLDVRGTKCDLNGKAFNVSRSAIHWAEQFLQTLEQSTELVDIRDARSELRFTIGGEGGISADDLSVIRGSLALGDAPTSRASEAKQRYADYDIDRDTVRRINRLIEEHRWSKVQVEDSDSTSLSPKVSTTISFGENWFTTDSSRNAQGERVALSKDETGRMLRLAVAALVSAQGCSNAQGRTSDHYALNASRAQGAHNSSDPEISFKPRKAHFTAYFPDPPICVEPVCRTTDLESPE